MSVEGAVSSADFPEKPRLTTLPHLLLKRGFTDGGVESALQSFLATQQYVELKGASAAYRNVPTTPPESPSEVDYHEPDNSLPPPASFQVRELAVVAPKPIFRDQPLEFSLSSKGLAITGSTNSARELRAFIQKLEALAVLLPEGESDPGN
jgi:hypothetical protein